MTGPSVEQKVEKPRECGAIAGLCSLPAGHDGPHGLSDEEREDIVARAFTHPEGLSFPGPEAVSD